jgi:PKD repeat protein
VYCSKYNQNEILELQLLADTFSINQILIENKSRGGLPNFNASYFYTPSIDFAYTEDCWEHKYSFEGRDTFDADGYKWIFEKSGFRDSILTKHCNYQFSDTGSWQVSHIAWNANRADTVTKTLTIRPKWQKDVLGRDTFYCAGSKANLVLQAPTDMHCVHWNGEEPNLDESLGPIVDYDHFHTNTFGVDTAGTYIVKLTNKTFCQMYDTIVVAEKPRPNKSVVSRLGNLLICDLVANKYRWYYNGALQQTTDSNFLDPNQNGNWQVQLVSKFGCEGELSDSMLVDFASIDPRLQDTGKLTFKIYPNPSSGKFTIELAKDGIYTIQLFENGGRLVSLSADPKGGVSKTEQGKVRSINKQIVLNLSLASGSYILSLTDENGNVGSKKIEISN